MSTYSVKPISGKERKVLIQRIKNIIKDPEKILPKKRIFRIIINKKQAAISVNNKEIILIEDNKKIFPYLKFARKVELLLPSVIVDIGAVKFVTNGADIMRPGITMISEEILEGNLVLVTEERNKAPLCIGIALYDSIDMKKMTSGKCIKNIHYLGDIWWTFKV